MTAFTRISHRRLRVFAAIALLLLAVWIRHQVVRMDARFFQLSVQGLKGLALYLVGDYGRAYNPVTNATSSKPFAPGIIIHGVERFLSGRGPALRACLPAPRPQATAGIVEVFVYGGPIRPGATGVVELERGAQPEGTTYDATGSPKALDYTRTKYAWFQFRLPPLP